MVINLFRVWTGIKLEIEILSFDVSVNFSLTFDELVQLSSKYKENSKIKILKIRKSKIKHKKSKLKKSKKN